MFRACEYLAISLARRPKNTMYFSPQVNLEVFLCLNVSRDQNLKMKEIGELVENLPFLDKQIGISERG